MGILEINDLSLEFGGNRVLSNVDLNVDANSIYAIIGPNGAGKTSLMNCINGLYKPSSGKILFKNKDITSLPSHKIAKLGIGRTFQNVEMFRNMSVLDNLLIGFHNHLKSGPIAGGILFGKALAEELKARKIVEKVIDFLEMDQWRRAIASKVPFGILKRIELGRALIQSPDIMLLDEPTTGMNAEETEDMVRFILDIYEEWENVTFIMVEHDMHVVMDIAQRICVLDFGVKIAEGTPGEIQNNPEVHRAYLGE